MLHQHTLFSQNTAYNDLFYLEYSTLDSQNEDEDYCFHLSFVTKEAAKRNYDIMENQWGLPVKIEGKRIIILSASDFTSTGVYPFSFETNDFSLHYYVGIRFQSAEHAKAFFKFAKPTLENKNEYSQIPGMMREGCSIHFPKFDLIHSNFLIDRRINQMNIIIDMMCTLKKIFMNNGITSNDIIFYCMHTLVLHELGKSNHYFNRSIELNKQFLFENQNITPPRQNKKIDVKIHCATLNSTQNEFSLYLTCLHLGKAKELFQIAAHCGLNIDAVSHDTIVIYPARQSQIIGDKSGAAFFDNDPVTLSIMFESEIDRYKFLESVNFVNGLIKECKYKNNSIRFNLSERIFSFEKDSIPDYVFQKENVNSANRKEKHRSNCIIS